MTAFLTTFLTVTVSLAFGFEAEARLYALDESHGEPRYVEVVSEESGGEVIVKHDSYVRGAFSTRRVQGTYRIASAQLITPAPTVRVSMQGIDRQIKRGDIVLRKDNQAYLIEDVFEDGRVVAHRVERSHSSKPATQNMDILEKENEHIFSANEIVAVKVACFLGYCTGRRYSEISGAPLCDYQALIEYSRHRYEPSQVPRLACRVGKVAEIDAVFSDGSIMFGKNIINLFPDTIHRYYRVEDQGGSSASPSAI